MTYTVSITSQGQVTIPKTLRDKYRVKNGGQALVEDRNDYLKVTPYSDDDFSSLFGCLQKQAEKINKGKSIDQVIKDETKAFHQGIVDSYKKSVGTKKK